MSEEASDLCVSCQLCCNGGFFPEVRINAAEARRLEQHLPGICNGSETGLPQPCIALHPLEGCTIYHLRPNGCQKFACSLLHRMKQGDIAYVEALDIVERARDLRAEADYGRGDSAQEALIAFKRLAKREFLRR